jgi:hypothetical protein
VTDRILSLLLVFCAAFPKSAFVLVTRVKKKLQLPLKSSGNEFPFPAFVLNMKELCACMNFWYFPLFIAFTAPVIAQTENFSFFGGIQKFWSTNVYKISIQVFALLINKVTNLTNDD